MSTSQRAIWPVLLHREASTEWARGCSSSPVFKVVLEVLLQSWWGQTVASGGLSWEWCPSGCPPWLHGQLHWAVMPWLSLLAHTLGEAGFTFSLLFILLILLSLSYGANTMVWQGKKDISRYGTDVHKYNLIFSCWQEVWLQAASVENTFKLFDTCLSSSPQSAYTWAGETKSNSSLQAWWAEHVALLSF